MTRHYATRTCSMCGEEHQPTSSTQKYCPECRLIVRRIWNQKAGHERYILIGRKPRICQRCGIEYQPANNSQKYCPICGLIVKKAKHAITDRRRGENQHEKRLEQRRLHRATHHEEEREYDRMRGPVYYIAHREHKIRLAVEWVRNHPEEHRVQGEKRRALKYGNTPVDEILTSAQWLAILAEANGHCHYCHQEAKLTLDHVIPLSKGGKHSKENVVPACKHCNCSKYNKTVETWNMSQRAQLEAAR